jgi:glycosyltransferase involved in cell wall biosynthesis
VDIRDPRTRFASSNASFGLEETPKERVVCVFNIDFGAPYGFGVDEYYRAKTLWKRGYLRKFLCRAKVQGYMDFDFDRLESILPLGNVFPRALTVLERITSGRLTTTAMEKKLIDKVASYKLDDKGGILYTTLDFINCIVKGKNLGYVIGVSMGPHPEWILEITEEENELMNIEIGHPALKEEILINELKSLEQADFFVVPSEFAKKTLLERGCKGRIFVNPLGVTIKKFTPSNRTNKNDAAITYLFVADATVMKGLQYLLEAWSQLKLKSAQLIICGKMGWDMKKIVRTYKSTKGVIFAGHVRNPWDYFRSASVFVLPSLIEGMSRVVLEAMASGLPVITTPNAGFVITDNEDGFIVPVRDVDALMEKILHFYENRSEIERMGANARRKAETLSWEKNSERTADIIEVIWRELKGI